MSYLALARKWRPKCFSQLLGQDHINKALTKSLNQQRIHHAYLFTGTRGVGKTSVARLMAKALNCEQGVSADPCLTCSSCSAIDNGNFVDLIEIDGASKTKVEDTRELLENIAYAPSTGRYKIYLIDEVHMLSQHSFNALLKTLEEPPAHVKFLLATTDPQKLPVTVLSRCLQFNLNHLSTDIITTQLKIILDTEQLSYDDDALQLIAKAADGSMRDALSLLDQAIASSDTLKVADIKTILGHSQQDYALQLLHHLAAQDASNLIITCRKIAKEGSYFNYVIDEILSYFHQMTLFHHMPDDPFINYSMAIKALATQFSGEDIQLFYQIAIKGREEMVFAPLESIGFEMMILRMLTFRPISSPFIPPLSYEAENNSTVQNQNTSLQPLKNTDSLKQPNEIAPTMAANFSEPPYLSCETTLPNESDKMEACFEQVLAINIEQDMSNVNLEWSDLTKQLKLTGLAQNAIEQAQLISKEEHQFILKVAKGHLSLFTPLTIQRINAALTSYFNKKMTITLQADNNINHSPAQQKQQQITLNLEQAKVSLENDSFFQQLKQEFTAEIVKNSIEPI